MATVPTFPRLRVTGTVLSRPQLASGSPFRDRMAGSWRLPCRVDATRGLLMSLLAAAPLPVGPNGMRFDATTFGGTLPITLSAAPYTIAVWYRANTTGSFNGRCIQGVTNNWLLGPYSAQYQLYNGAGFVAGGTVTRFPVVHVATDDGTTLSQFINGVAAGTRATSGHPGALAIGKGAFAESADSDIANVTIWTRAFTAAEVQQLPINPDHLYKPRTVALIVNTSAATAKSLWWWNTYGQAGY